MAPLSKSGILDKTGIVGSNPTLSAITLTLTERCPSWPKEHDWKSCILPKVVSRVRIPLSPPFPILCCIDMDLFFR